MLKYYKAILDIFKNYKLYSFQVLFYELIFITIYKRKFNKFEYLNSNFLSNSIPCPFFFLKIINKFIIKKNLKQLCDLGSGFGKVVYYFGKIIKLKIDGVELENEIYKYSKVLEDKNIKIYNENILKFDLKKKKYDLFILNDPLKKKHDLLKLILILKKKCPKAFFVFVNLDKNKQVLILNNLKIIENFKISKNKNVFICKI